MADPSDVADELESLAVKVRDLCDNDHDSLHDDCHDECHKKDDGCYHQEDCNCFDEYIHQDNGHHYDDCDHSECVSSDDHEAAKDKIKELEEQLTKERADAYLKSIGG